jgi:VIT1/CCC1 family predicted Fe2+/Mn2+ transporter
VSSGESPAEGQDGLGSRRNVLRAGVLGVNDGLVSAAGLVIGVAGATNSTKALLTAGLAGLLAGSLSLAAGEYVSVSSHRDSERAALDQERRQLADAPKDELAELAGLYQARGLPAELAREVAVHLTAHDALGAHAEAELGIDPDEMASPWHAARASLVSFAAGALLPLLADCAAPGCGAAVRDRGVRARGPGGVRVGQRPCGARAGACRRAAQRRRGRAGDGPDLRCGIAAGSVRNLASTRHVLLHGLELVSKGRYWHHDYASRCCRRGAAGRTAGQAAASVGHAGAGSGHRGLR